MDVLFTIAIYVLVIGGLAGSVALTIWSWRAEGDENAKLRQDAMAQFDAWQGTAGAAQLDLQAGQCQIVQESETIGRGTGASYAYTLTRFLRNANGDYFMFKSTPTGPYVKSVTAEIAKVVLKEKYVA